MTNKLMISTSQMPPITSFEAYKSYAISIPNLSEEEERELLIKFKECNSLEAAQKLVLSQLKAVIYIASKHRGYGLPQEDLVQEGNIGLMKAVKNFNISNKVRLYTYAIIWIKSEIQSYILKNWKIVKIATTKNLKKLFFGFKSTQKELLDKGTPKEEVIRNISIKLGVSESEIQEIQGYLNNEDVSINYEQDESSVFEIPYLQTPEDDYEDKHDGIFYNEKIQKSLKLLNDKQREVIKYRFLTEEKLTHKEISEKIKVSSERVRQIENEALLKLRTLVTQ